MNALDVSFEFFPPKTAAMEENLWQAVRKLEPLQPGFVSVTYGAGGSTRERTHNTVKRILDQTSLKPAAHSGMPRWQDHLFIALSRTANDATDYFQIPSGRVVEVGTQVTI